MIARYFFILAKKGGNKCAFLYRFITFVKALCANTINHL